MLHYAWPIMLTVAANCIYSVSAKQTPADANAFLTLTVSYLVAALASLLLYLGQNGLETVGVHFGKLNWTAVALGLAVVCLELGSIFMYRVGWNMSTGPLVVHICLAVVMVALGVLLYKEVITLRMGVGIVVCLIGLVLITK